MEKYEIEHYNTVRRLGPECMVLLKTDGSIPLSHGTKIALFGAGARGTFRGGTGGGIVEVRRHTDIEEGLINAGFEVVSQNWLDSYDKLMGNAKAARQSQLKQKIATEGMTGLGALNVALTEPDYDFDLQCDADACVYVIARVSGEGADREDKKGDTRLTDTEIRDITALCRKFRKFVLVLNVSGIVDLSPVADFVPNILVLSQTGIAIGDSFADVLCGKAYPSGKLATTWTRIEDYQRIGDWVQQDDTRYREGIYVGYRYFDAVGKQPMYPFGFGLSYTEFEIGQSKVTLCGTEVNLTVNVKNVGKRVGKEVVQVYASMPDDYIDCPPNVLCAFAKTAELSAGQEQVVEIAFDLRNVATFDDKLCANILPRGKYVINVGNSSRNLHAACVVELDKIAIVQKLSHVGGKPDFDDFIPEKNNREIPNVPPLKLCSSDVRQIERKPKPTTTEANKFVSALSDDEVLKLLTGGFAPLAFFDRNQYTAGQVGQTAYDFEKCGLPSVSMADGPSGLHISGECGIDEKGIYSQLSDETKAIKEILPQEIFNYLLTIFPNAANGDRQGEPFTQYCTAIPIETAVAQSFSCDVARQCAEIVAEELKLYNIDCWLAPALNIHRHPLCGRNFEYFSEDPYLSGVLASTIVSAVQENKNKASCLKHFVCNEQDTNRLSSNSIVSERALRDIYMKPFEITIANSSPKAVMSSYNLVNGIHTSERADLMETALREQFGFSGIVMSDWVGYHDAVKTGFKHARARAGTTIAAGNDLMMPGQEGHYKELKEGLEKGTFTTAWARKCATRIVDWVWTIKN